MAVHGRYTVVHGGTRPVHRRTTRDTKNRSVQKNGRAPAKSARIGERGTRPAETADPPSRGLVSRNLPPQPGAVRECPVASAAARAGFARWPARRRARALCAQLPGSSACTCPVPRRCASRVENREISLGVLLETGIRLTPHTRHSPRTDRAYSGRISLVSALGGNF